MKKRLFSILTATAMTLSAVPFVVSAESDTNTELWEKFLKYDLCITDFDSLTDEEKNLCRFIYDTELDYYKSESDFAICERARRILKHDTNIGERVTAEELKDCYGIYDKYRYGTGYLDYIQCVPDISYYNFETGSYTEYWFDESGDNKAVFSETDGEYVTYNITIIENGKTVKETETKIHPNLALKKDEYGYPKNEITITDDLIEYNDDYYYITSQNTAVLFKNKECNDLENTHVIPEKVNGYPVTAIESKAFYCSEYKKVELPESLEFIGDSAFAFSQKLEEINFPSNLKLIGSGSFEYTKLKNIYVDCPDAVISSGAFADIWCELNAYVNAKEIKRYAFSESIGLNQITLGKNVEIIGENVFNGCNLYDIELSEGLKSIGQGAFREIPFISSVRIPSTVDILGTIDSVIPFAYRLSEKPNCVFNEDCIIIGAENSESEKYAVEWNLPFMKSEIEIPNTNPDINDNEEIKGDANCDGNVNMADAVLIMQSLANPDKYGINGTDETHITAQGEKNGDMDGNGLTNADALEIQKMLLKIS